MVTKTFDGNPAGHFEYVHDSAGNRVTALSPGRTAHWQVDAANQLQAQIALGPRRIVGTVNEPSHVKINGNFVPVDENFRFEGMVDSSETRNVTIEATDADNNVTTTEYRFAEPDNTAGAVLRHDANGRLVEIERPDETVSYTWDAMDQLIQAEVMARDGSTGKRKTYGYDPAGRMVRTDLETWDGSSWVVSGTGEQYIYAGLDKIQKRVTNNTLIARSYYADGYITGSTRYYYGRDHLGSIVELVEGSTGNIVSTREFSPYGEILSETGTTFASFGFTGHFYDEDFSLHHAPARVYDAALGRWLTPDPYTDAELLPEGTNLYAYVGNDPVNYTDPYGWCRQSNDKNNGRRADGSGGGKGPPRRVAASASPSPGDPGGGGGDGTGFYKYVKGHHVHAKAGFRDHLNYDFKRGFSVSQRYMKSRGWSHQAMTNKQRQLFRELSSSGKPNTLREHTRIAVQALMEGGATQFEARSLVAKSLLNLRQQGVRGVTNIPWY